jgi:protein-tyrosine-phosphatase
MAKVTATLRGECMKRILTVCGGNTCRSPVLACLLLAELRRNGRPNVEVESAGASEHFSEHAAYKGPLNFFARAALREALATYDDSYSSGIFDVATSHVSHYLSSVEGQKFDLIIFLDTKFEEEPKRLGIQASLTDTRHVADSAYLVWKNAGEPESSEGDPSNKVLNAYREQTMTLRKYAIELVSKLFVEHG